MPYQSKKAITSLFTGALILAAYCIYAFGKYDSGSIAEGDLIFWASTMLIFIAIGIVANIVIQIVFHIVLSIGIAIKERESDEKVINRKMESEMVEDEMNKLIGLKSMRISFAIVGFGFVGALVFLVLGRSMTLALNILYFSFNIGGLAEAVASLYFYGKGVSNG